MFRQAAASAKSAKGGGGNSSQSDSDWDTTVDFPVGHTAGDGNADNTDDDIPVQPKPKSRVTLADKGKEEKTGDGTPHSARGDKTGSAGKRNLKTPASATAVRLSTFDSDSRETSPVPPFNFGFGDARKKNTDNIYRGSPVSPSSAGKGHGDNRYEMSPTPKIPASMEVPLPKWDDSDAEQQTLEELRNTLKKEKIRESGNKTARKSIQEGGDNSMVTDHNSSVIENHRQGKGDKTSDKQDQMVKEDTTTVQERKSEVTSFPTHWLQKDRAGMNTLPLEENAPYQPFIIKNPDGKRFLYCFSEGNTAFYEVEEEETEAVMPKVADKVEGYIKRGWQEFFGILRIVTSVIISLVVETVSFVTDHIARPLLLGVILMTGNRLVKPLLAGLFSLILQPFVIFLWNVVSGLRHVSQPLIDILGLLMAKVAVLLQAFRLVEVNLGSDYYHNQRGGGGRSEIV